MTPMMKQYSEIKTRHPGYLLLYRMGDFYELFNEDAVTASKVLGLTLTQRNHGGDGDTPLAGFPYHAIERYMPRLMNAGLKVAVCEQVEDPAEAKGVVKREVTEIVTVGTAMSDNYLDAKTNNYLVSLFPDLETDRCGLACLDLSTGRFVVMEGSWEQALGEVYRIGAREAVFPENLELPASLAQWRDQEKALLTVMPKGLFNLIEGTALLTRQFKVHSLEAFDCAGMTLGIRAAAAALGYVRDTKKSELNHLVRLTPSRFDQHMALDAATVRNLELIKPIHGEDESGTLFHLLDRTVTAMGGRTLKHWLTHPLLDRAVIAQRQDAIQELLDNPEALENLRRHLQAINDMERIVAKCGAGRVHARDLVGLGASLVAAGEAGKCLAALEAEVFRQGTEKLVALTGQGTDLLGRLTERPPLTVREGGMIRPGVYPELDELVNGIRDGREWLNGLQAREREATGINSLKVGFNKVFGYYIEVTKTNEDKVPPHYLRKQSLVGAERYITPEMKEWENRILGAESEINAQEYKIFCGIRESLNAEAAQFLEAAQILGAVDTLCCLAVAARERRFRRPVITEGSELRIEGGRHPVVEAITEEGAYIANDVDLDARGRQILLITGPNMAGKSTYLRQAGLIVLLAQIGSFVPAESARIGLVDRIFTRVGATDRLAKGQSTFMVEMIETANILNHATPRSLVLLDEIGRGTSTYDGLSLAWAIVEALHEDARIAARTLFATHYHELTQLAARLPRLRNVQVTVKEADGQVIFLRKVIEGGCDSSYGIHVAKMAGVPEPVVDRAWEILADLEKHGHATTVTAGTPGSGSQAAASASTGRGVTQGLPEPGPRAGNGRADSKRPGLQVDLFGMAAEPENPAHRKAYEEILALDVNALTPLQLMLKIAELQQKLRATPSSSPAARRATA
jgi:DNA mismatch repair protein MutS